MADAFFTVLSINPEVLQPTQASASGWSPEHVHGPAVSAVLARATERVADEVLPGRRLVRWTVDMFRPARMLPTTANATVFRQGRRIGLIDAELTQNGQPVARSRALFAHAAETPDGQVWAAERALEPPPLNLVPLPGERRLYNSDHRGWTADPDEHLGGAHKQTWTVSLPVIEDEEPSRLQVVAGVADVTNLVTSWGSAGVEFINADITLAITRYPVAVEVGLSALDRTVCDGIAVGTAIVFDRVGQLGTATVVTLANPGIRDSKGGRPGLPGPTGIVNR